ncbi:universal stress protein [Nocardia sp. NPDC088792]|uniref:universal stress protein n=1 Tax=Nocardia sp. NPDC088792 TaxID=3364332 RepID=UPI00380527DD
MPHIYLIHPTEESRAVARALADITEASVRAEPANRSDDEYLRALTEPDVLLGVIALEGAGLRIAQRAQKPLVLVPEQACPSGAIKRVLVPLDGTDESAHAVAETVQLFRAAGTEIVVLHVFDSSTVPAYWDQAAHARAAWEDEFLARYCTPHLPGPAPTLTLRSGAPGESVVEVADDQMDLVILGWSQRPEPGRAQTVRKIVEETSVPVMLIPTSIVT